MTRKYTTWPNPGGRFFECITGATNTFLTSVDQVKSTTLKRIMVRPSFTTTSIKNNLLICTAGTVHSRYTNQNKPLYREWSLYKWSLYKWSLYRECFDIMFFKNKNKNLNDSKIEVAVCIPQQVFYSPSKQ